MRRTKINDATQRNFCSYNHLETGLACSCIYLAVNNFHTRALLIWTLSKLTITLELQMQNLEIITVYGHACIGFFKTPKLANITLLLCFKR